MSDPGAVPAMRLLAVRDPYRAELLYDTMKLGILLVEGQRRG